MEKESNVIHQGCENLCLCPLKGIIDVISKKWALLIINAIGNYERPRFKKLMEVLPGISPKTLSDTLKELESEGLIKRESFAEIPPRVEYSLTKDGMDLREAIIPLLRWTANRNGGAERCRCNAFYEHISAHVVENKDPEQSGEPI
ncbi:MAG: helix-turn-helix transcriptional regulator [Methanotrichaceae archaeon]|nr:helix-turn-helix transcriptional regulator [Methanotrichaceae archaeon]